MANPKRADGPTSVNSYWGRRTSLNVAKRQRSWRTLAKRTRCLANPAQSDVGAGARRGQWLPGGSLVGFVNPQNHRYSSHRAPPRLKNRSCSRNRPARKSDAGHRDISTYDKESDSTSGRPANMNLTVRSIDVRPTSGDSISIRMRT